MLEQFIPQLAASQPLTDEQVRLAVEQLVAEGVPAVLKADFLTQLARKGETIGEIAAFARELRARAIQPVLDGELRASLVLDVVGTGGDRLSTFNISTTVALLAAAAGVRVAKHGNRASTSPIGSADVMEALGVPFDLGPEAAVQSLRDHNFAYFFAPKYHTAFRHVVPARKLCAARGQGTIFNFLGPLVNPAHPSAALIGVPRPDLCEPLAHVLQSLGLRRAMVVCGAVPPHPGPLPLGGGEGGTRTIRGPLPLPRRGGEGRGEGAGGDSDGIRSAEKDVRYLDELSPLGPTTIAEFYQERALTCSSLPPEAFPLQPATLADLHGGDREVNAGIIRRVLKGEERGPKRDAVLLNAAAALFVADRTRSLADGWELAAETIDSGRAAAKLAELQKKT